MRQTVRFVLGFSIMAGLSFALLSTRVAHADPSADDCVGFERRDADKGVEYSIKNECEKKLACSVSWKLSCENGDGKVTQTKNLNERFRVAESEEHTVVASATECKAGWRIDAVAWSCDEAR